MNNRRSGLISLIGASLFAISVLNVWQASTKSGAATISSSSSAYYLASSNNHLKASLQEFISESERLKTTARTGAAAKKNLSPSDNKEDPAADDDAADDDDEKELESGDLPHLQHLQQQDEDNDNVADSLQQQQQHRAHLSCEKEYGGPNDEYAQEMVYWSDIPSDTRYVSPFHSKKGQHRRYLTFEPDGGGWNNIRMAMETVLGLAIAMGRTLVLPPEQRMYLLAKNRGKQKTDFSFADFFPVHEMAQENEGLEIITMEEFLQAEAMTGNLRDKNTGEVSFPPDNRTDWNGKDVNILKEWLRNVTHTPIWGPGKCLAAFPASGDHKDVELLRQMQKEITQDGGQKVENFFLENPPPVDAAPIERMRENLSGRSELCVYDEAMQNEPVVHFMCYHKMRVRMLVHFYAFLYFEDWREDLWVKRFMRDHVRYTDEIQCAAARVVHAMRQYALSRNPQGNGEFDTFHVRRGDFQFKATRIDATEIYENVKDVLPENSTVYIATDERDKKFFDPMREHYDIKFLDDFKDVWEGINVNYLGMMDQLVASRGRLFFGCWHSTFTGFIHRMRGYHSVKDKAEGHENGLLPTSYYYVTLPNKFAMHKYAKLHGAFFNREFPTSWRDIDKGIGNLPNILEQ